MAISILYPWRRFRTKGVGEIFSKFQGEDGPDFDILDGFDCAGASLILQNFRAVGKQIARAKTSKNFREKFEKVVPCTVSGEKQNRNGLILSQAFLHISLAADEQCSLRSSISEIVVVLWRD